MTKKFGSFLRFGKQCVVNASRPLHRQIGKFKKTPIIDCFMFYNELDLLELRLRTLYNHVTRFVLSECPMTIAGDPKPLYFLENKSRFEPFLDKITHQITPPPTKSDFNIGMQNLLSCEFYQRRSVAQAIKNEPDSVITLFSDLDEIPNPVCFSELQGALTCGHEFVTLRQHWHLLYLNARVVESRNQGAIHDPNKWFGTMACTRGTLRRIFSDDPNNIWARKWGGGGQFVHKIRNGGWHFSYLGGAEKVHQKLKAGALPALSKKDAEDLRAMWFLGAKFSFVAIDKSYPSDIIQRPKTYAALMSDPTKYRSQLETLIKGVAV